MDAPRNAFSIDVEDYFHVSAFESLVDRSSWDSLESRVVENTRRILELLATYNVSATFFVLGWVAKKYPSLVRTIASDGHEIACHGYSHKKVYNQSPTEFEREVQDAKTILEDCVGQDVIGYRAASFSITKSSLWALDILVDNGFKYDSSIYPVWHDNYGIPGAKKDPSLLSTPRGQTLAEFPLTAVDLAGVPIPVAGGGYFRLYPYWVTRKLLKLVGNGGRSINFYCHPWEIDCSQPRFSNASWKSRFRHYNNIEKVEERLKRLLEDFSFSGCADVLRSRGLIAA